MKVEACVQMLCGDKRYSSLSKLEQDSTVIYIYMIICIYCSRDGTHGI